MEDKRESIHLSRLYFGRCNIYVVEHQDHVVLIDTGLLRHWTALRTLLRPYLSCKSRLILLFHTHFDHAGNAQVLSKFWKAPVALHPLEMSLVK